MNICISIVRNNSEISMVGKYANSALLSILIVKPVLLARLRRSIEHPNNQNEDI